MKKLITIALLTAATARAALPVYPFPLTPPTGVSPYLWSDANFWTNSAGYTNYLLQWQVNRLLRQSLSDIATEFSLVETQAVDLGAALTNLESALPDAATNAVLNSGRVLAWTTNGISLAAGATNFVGWITNLAGIDFATNLGMPSLQFSFDGTNYVNGSRTLVTNVPVKVAFYSGSTMDTNSLNVEIIPMPGAVTNVTIWKLARPDLFGRTNAMYGEIVLVGEPRVPSQVATKNYVDNIFANTPWWSAGTEVQLNQYALHFNLGWAEHVAGSQGTELHTEFLGQDAYTVSYTPATTVTNTIAAAIDGTGTNVVITVATNGVSSGVRLMFTHVLSPMNWQLLNSAPVLTGGQWVFTVPFPWTDSGFCAATIPSPNPGVLTLQAVLALTPRTITNATDTTWGYGAGLVVADTNYVNISVGTNHWKRAALTSW